MKNQGQELNSLLSLYQNLKNSGRTDKSLLKRIQLMIQDFMQSGNLQLKRIAISAMFVLGSTSSFSQHFAAPTTPVFGANVTSQLSMPELVDIDNDGDLDMFVGTYYGGISYFENTGSATAPAFGSEVPVPFGLDTVDNILAYLSFADLDNDGDQDLITGGGYGYTDRIFYYENIGTASAPNFAAPLSNAFNMGSMGADVYISFPEFADIDGDGDFDIIAGVYDTYYAKQFVYFENTGIPAVPNFLTPPVNDPYSLNGQFTRFGIPRLVDIDLDGDLDMFAGGEYGATYFGTIDYLENTGTNLAPTFAPKQSNQFGIQDSTLFLAFVTFGDIDGDGDQDMIAGEYSYYNARLFYYENVGVNGVNDFDKTNAINLFPNPTNNQSEITSEETIQKIELLDPSGKLIRTEAVNRTNYRIDLTGLASGMYFVSIYTEKEKRSIRVVKK